MEPIDVVHADGADRDTASRLRPRFARVLKVLRSTFRRRRRAGRSDPLASLSMYCRPVADIDEEIDCTGRLAAMSVQDPGSWQVSSSSACSFPVVQEHSQRQKLLTIGSRTWGSKQWWDGRGLLALPVYDFAVYIDGEQAHEQLQLAQLTSCPSGDISSSRPATTSSCGGWGMLPRLPGISGNNTQLLPSSCDSSKRNDPYEQLGCAGGGCVDMSLTIRAARNLPVPQLGDEFRKVLQRRIVKVGGSEADPALAEVLSYFHTSRLPPTSVVGDAVKCGAAITFERQAGGLLSTYADGSLLGSVQSPKVCEALFDLYLGDQPVSQPAKIAAGDVLRRMAQDSEQYYRPSRGDGMRMLCGTGSSDPDTCAVVVR